MSHSIFSRTRWTAFALISLAIVTNVFSPSYAANSNQGKPLFGDLEDILKRGTLRVLVEYNHTRFLVVGGQLRGFEYELVNHFFEDLRQRDTSAELLKIVYIPMPFERILPALAEGYGDIAAAGLTITPKRSESVRFSSPYLRGVREVVVAGKRAAPIETLADLAGQTVHVQQGTSFAAHAHAAAERLKKDGFKSFELVEEDLQTSSLLEMANAGIIDYVIQDDYVANIWVDVMENISTSDVSVSNSGDIAWALRKDAPKLAATVNAFIDENRKGSLLGNILFKRYFEDVEWISNPIQETRDRDRLLALRDYFKAASEEQKIQWLLLAAQGYQESRLDQSVVSSAGAVGVMQLLPSTAKDPVIGGANIHDARENIIGGARYLRYLRDRYEGIGDRFTPWSFAFAAYNAGPGRLRQARKLAGEKGLDPDKWTGNVEYAMMSLVGMEPVRYVGNIRMYYLAYQGLLHVDKTFRHSK